jgi:aminopeptidase YwaD
MMNNRNVSKYIAGLLVVFSVVILYSCNSDRKITVTELQNHVKFLSSDSLKGRLTGSPGDSLAAEYIKNEFISFGLQPLSGDGLQRFKVTTRLVAGQENDLSVNEKIFAEGKDFVPFSISSNGGLISEAVFAGYGFNINTDSLKWNDYKDTDVKDRWVIILRADPEIENTNSPFIPYSGDRDKALQAKDMGAAGVLMVSGPAFDQQDTFESLNSGDLSVGIPVIRIKREVADYILSKSKKTIESLEKKINESLKPSSFATGTIVSAKAEVIREMNNTRNVVMILPGEDEVLKDEYIIIGAHFDHLGMGGPGSGSRIPDTVAIHHGADDNASGVSMMLELAEKFAHTKGSHKRSIICIAFTGEELGFLGSKFFVENPGIDLAKVNAMINLDMVGRLQDSTRVLISGVGTAPGLRDLINSKNDSSLIRLTLSEEGFGPSDYSSFYGKNIPVLACWTGTHLDYHTPADTYDKINYKGMVTISALIFSVAENLASSPERLQFREAGPKVETGRAYRRKMITLGITPDFAGNIRNGLRADFVTPGKPAALGGMKKGDIITAINGKSVNNIYDYMSRMGQLKHGQTINVEILRGNNKMVLLIQL